MLKIDIIENDIINEAYKKFMHDLKADHILLPDSWYNLAGHSYNEVEKLTDDIDDFIYNDASILEYIQNVVFDIVEKYVTNDTQKIFDAVNEGLSDDKIKSIFEEYEYSIEDFDIYNPTCIEILYQILTDEAITNPDGELLNNRGYDWLGYALDHFNLAIREYISHL